MGDLILMFDSLIRSCQMEIKEKNKKCDMICDHVLFVARIIC